MSRTEAFNVPRTVRLDSGAALRVRALTQFEWGEITQYIVDHVPSPMEQARRNLLFCPGLDPQDRRAILYEAGQEPWPPRVHSPAWRKAMDRAPDQDAITRVLLRAMIRDDLNPGIDRDALAGKMTAADFNAIFAACYGFDPGPDDDREGDPGPKATTPDTAPASPTTSTGGPSATGS